MARVRAHARKAASRRRSRIAVLIWVGWIVAFAWFLFHLERRDQIVITLLALFPLLWIVRDTLGGALQRVLSGPWREPDRPQSDRTPPQADEGRPVDGQPEEDSVTGSGFYDAPSGLGPVSDAGMVTGEFSIIDMVNRLEPGRFQWIDSSLAEQEFLGFTLGELKKKSFLDVVPPSDRPFAEEVFRRALAQGEIHDVVVRVRTAQGTTKAVEISAGARYNADHRVTYIRCHLTDVTQKLRSERRLRLRTRELIRVNGQLRQINRELEQLKDRYSDLYENAPAMYFSLDKSGHLVECNRAFLAALDRVPEEVLGQGLERFVQADQIAHCHALIVQLMERDSLESESRWVRSNGELIDVLVTARMARGPRDESLQTRCVAQDITAKKQLEAELRTTNQSLQRANAELSVKNRELDEFVYVVSHDLQEPLRTLTAFSDYLLKDQGDRLGPEGSKHVRYLVDASRRMRAMIGGLLKLSRAGKVVEDFAPVSLADLVAVTRTDLAEMIRVRGARIALLDRDATLWGDAQRLQQLLSNLVSNGVKYNRSPVPTVEVGLFRGPGPLARAVPTSMLVIFVRDNGIGIERRHHQRIFQPFRRLHADAEFEGEGVGLPTCAKIVHAHGGELWVDSELGQGTTFFFTLPRPPESDLANSDSASNPRNPSSAA